MNETDYHPLVSVIVPVYNVEKYLDRCLESIVKQTYGNLEIILIDDGSTDASGDLCDAWSKKDTRIKVQHFENCGVSAARNRGIEATRGSWIVFIDPDDYVGENHILNLLSTALGMDVSLAITTAETTLCGEEMPAQKTIPSGYKLMDAPEAMSIACEARLFGASVCGRIFSSQLTKFLKFPEGKYYEDQFITYRVFAEAGQIAYENARDYYYVRLRPSSTTTTADLKLLDLLDADRALIAFAANQSLFALEQAATRRYYSHLISAYTRFTAQDQQALADKAYEYIRAERRSALLNPTSRASTKIAFLASYLPRFMYSGFLDLNEKRLTQAKKKEWEKKAHDVANRQRAEKQWRDR